MRVKDVIKVIVALCLSLVLLVPMFGCGNDPVDPNKGELEKQTENLIFYFQQGYKEGWDLIGKSNGHYSDPEKVLVVELKPQTDAESVRYSIHKQEEDENNLLPMTVTLEQIIKMVMDPECELYFNLITGERENFKFTAEDYHYEIVNGNQFAVVPYEFSENGKEWQGKLHILTDARKFFIITFEAAKDKYATYEPDFNAMLKDFRKRGFESDSSIS